MRFFERRFGRELAVLAIVFAMAAALAAVSQSHSTPHYKLSAAAAIAAARQAPIAAGFLHLHPATRAQSIPLDDTLRRVTFFNGPRVILDVAVDPHGVARAYQLHPPGVPAQGATLANRTWVLLLFTALFLLAVAVTPLWRLRNLDALALAAFTVNVMLVNARLIKASVIVSVPLLVYLAARCLIVGLRGQRPPPPQAPLLDRLTASVQPKDRVRLLYAISGATALALLMITLTSGRESDVAAASLSGATSLLHGVAPYGHILPTIVHGDTYPLLAYVLYIPGALWTPVSDAFADLSGALPIAAAGALFGALALWWLARKVDDERSTPASRSTLAPRMLLAWFAFPPLLLSASTGSNDLVLAALLAWALVLCAHTQRSTLLLAAAIWTKVVPLTLLPLWLVRGSRREGLRALVPVAALSVVLCVWLLALGGTHAVGDMISGISFQNRRASFFAPWYTLSVRWLQPIVQGAVVALLVAAVWALRRTPAIGRDPVRLAGLCGGLLLGLELAASYWTFSYLPWVLPFAIVALLLGQAREAHTDADVDTDGEPRVVAPAEPVTVAVAGAEAQLV